MHTIENKRFEYFNTWYHPVIRELVTATSFNEDYLKLGRMVSPTITAKEAHNSVRLLLDLHLIGKGVSKYHQLQTNIIAQSESDFMALRKYQKQLIQLGSESIERFAPGQRNILSVTLGVSQTNAQRINDLVNEFHNNLLTIATMEQEVETTQQVNVQLFPVSKNIKNNRE